MINKLKQRLNQIKNNKGTIYIYTLLTLVVLVPAMLFASLELPNTLAQHRKLKNVLDNAASSASSRIIEQQLHYGIIEIDSTLAEQSAKRIIAQSYKLDPITLEPLDGSLLTKAPIIQIRTVNNPPSAGTTITFPTETIKILEPSVAIYMEIEVKGIFFTFYNPIIKHIGATQARF